MAEIIPDRKYAKMAKVKNKAIAPVQITAEQLLREANERKEVIRHSTRTVSDPEELYEVYLSKRRSFEESVRRNRGHISTWLKYASWEHSINEIERARSIFERAIDVDCRNITTWLRYAEMEMKLKNVNHARNIWNRAITQLPRVDQFWYKYAYMEEVLGDIEAARQVYERWMTWEPAIEIWSSFVKFERRYGDLQKVRGVFERFIQVHPVSKAWLKYAKFEIEERHYDRARRVFERAVDVLHDATEKDQKLYVQFAKFETRMKEYDRARIIYKHAITLFPENKAQSLYNNFTQFEKQYGAKAGIEEAIVSKRRLRYEEELKESPSNYDCWLNLIRLEESHDVEAARKVYERAVLQVPPTNEKRFWRRYIFLWINYAIFEELIAKDFSLADSVYKRCIALIPHKTFTFAKIWRLYAEFLLRRLDLSSARKVMGRAMGQCPKPRIFKDYIGMEMELREFDRCRIIYEKYLLFNSTSSSSWLAFAEFEKMLNDCDRVRGIYELAISQSHMDASENVWKSFIEFEYEEGEYEKCRRLYEQLLARTEHVKVWISYASFERQVENVSNARAIYERAYSSLKQQKLNEERVILLDSWHQFEESISGNSENIDKVFKLFPKRVKKLRAISETSMEEYVDYLWPDEETKGPHLKLLEMAHKWKKQQASN